MRHFYDLVCVSHLRWDFVFQRPQHLLSRFARERRVFFVEEPTFGPDPAHLDVSERPDHGVTVAVPRLPHGTPHEEIEAISGRLLHDLFQSHRIGPHVLWYYTPMALNFTRELDPLARVYDCMDELSAFMNAPPALRASEAELLRLADVVFTGGFSLFEAKRHMHKNIHPVPSSVDVPHFAKARDITGDPADQAAIPKPRAGFFGVIDERMDLDLLAGLADARPDLQLVMIGPVVKIDPANLPRRPNIHWLGGKKYDELPAYIAGWDVAILPFARNDSTRFISPTKTPEYLAAGRPVVSTSIRDVVRPYGDEKLVRIADNPGDFAKAIGEALGEDAAERIARVDAMLAQTSWDQTFSFMSRLIDEAVDQRSSARSARGALAGASHFTQAEGSITGSPATMGAE
jgi:UDP-galactopyranose mutase